MSTKHVRTVADLIRFGAGIKIECRSCGASRTLDGYQAAKIAGSIQLVALQAKLKCGRCGVKDARVAILPPV